MKKFTPIEYLVPDVDDVSSLSGMEEILKRASEISDLKRIQVKDETFILGYSFKILGDVEVKVIELSLYLTDNYRQLDIPDDIKDRLDEDNQTRSTTNFEVFTGEADLPLFMLIDVDNRLEPWVMRKLAERITSYHGGYLPYYKMVDKKRVLASHCFLTTQRVKVDMIEKDVFKNLAFSILA